MTETKHFYLNIYVTQIKDYFTTACLPQDVHMDGYPCRHCEASRIHVTHKHATQHQSVVVVHIISTPLQLKTLRPTLFKISLACLHNKQQRGGQWPRIGRFRDRRTDCVSQWTEMILHAFCMFLQVSFALSQMSGFKHKSEVRGEWPTGICSRLIISVLMQV